MGVTLWQSGFCRSLLSVSNCVKILFVSRSEHNILGQYEESLKFEEASLCAAIDCLRTDDVICPVCKRWVVVHHVIYFPSIFNYVGID